jgi:hypothetical protein
MTRKPAPPEPSVFYRRRKGKTKITFPKGDNRPVAVKMETKGRDRGGGTRGGR